MTHRPHVLLVCSGLDHAHRGYESFARECFKQLRGSPDLTIELVKGSGPSGPGETSVPTLRRDRMIARAVGRATGARSFRLEALAFSLSLQSVLARRRPDVVYLSEWDTARGLARLRSVFSQDFKLALCNGGFADRDFGHLDHVQELTPVAREHVLQRGADPARHSVLPLGFAIERELVPVSASERHAIRAKWQLPTDRPILVSVAALNRSHKRLDYLIDEIASLEEPRPFVLMVGAADAETSAVRRLAEERLGSEHHRLLTVAAEEVPELLRASNVFTLASVSEMQGRAVIEAMAQGLPCFVHDSPVMRFAVGDHGFLADFTRPGSLTRMFTRGAAIGSDPDAAMGRHRFVYNRFSWDSLRPRYVELLTAVSGAAPNRMVSSSTGEKLST